MILTGSTIFIRKHGPARLWSRALLLFVLCPMAPLAQATTDSASKPAPAAAEPVPPHVVTSTCAQPVYPPEAFAANLTGSVLLTIQVSAEGKATKVDIATSSGNAQLDAAAATGMGQCQFTPSTVNGKPVASTTDLKYTFRIDTSTPEEAAAQQKMKAVISILSMAKRIDAITGRCGTQEGVVGKNSKKAREQWHKRNDETVRQSAQTEDALFAEFRGKNTDTQAADAQIAKSRKAIEDLTDRGAAAELETLESPDDLEEAGNCEAFNNSALGGQYDLEKVFPEFVTEVQSASKPAAKK